MEATAIDVVRDIAGVDKIHALGFCVGGTIMSCAAGVLAARGEDKLTSLTLLTTMLDFADTGEIGLLIDQTSVGFLSQRACASLRRFALIEDYLDRKAAELERSNAGLVSAGRDLVNTRRATNIGTFRTYVLAYLQAHPSIAQDMTLLVRQLEPTSLGLPLEIYAFTNTTAWADYEAIQSDIFDHLIAILPEFLMVGFKVAPIPVVGPWLDTFLNGNGLGWITEGLNLDFYFGGTSLLIVVGVAMDTVSQIEAQLVMRHYDGFGGPGGGRRIRGRR